MPASILAIGTALPDCSGSQSDLCELFKPLSCDSDQQRRVLSHLYKRTKIGRRFSVLLSEDSRTGATTLEGSFFASRRTTFDTGPSTAQRMSRYHEAAGALAQQACAQALFGSRILPAQITHLVTVSCTGFAAPGIDLHLIDELKLNRQIERTNIGFMGCHGALNGLRVARAFCQAHPQAHVLLCATEICSLHFQYGWQHDALMANSLFADGAAALVMCGSPEDPPGPGSAPDRAGALVYAASASYVVPASQKAMTWYVGDNGFIMTLEPNVPDLIDCYLRQFLESWLATRDLLISDIKGWAVHPGGPRILEAVHNALRLDEEALSTSRQILQEYGNMSSPTVLFILNKLNQDNHPKPWVLLAFGPGLTIEAGLIT
jgi:predicted naringenin-chalcone synthase